MKATETVERIRNIVGKRVKEARRLHFPPLTQDRLSGKLASKGIQLDRVAIAKIETGRRCVFDYEVKALAVALKVDVKWILGIAGGIRTEPSSVDSGKRRL